jgi:redox-sensitive bicupin YhaK (pirin superfamily)
MIRHLSVENLYKSNPAPWLEAIYHFSFANYNNPENIQFGALRVLNDDLVLAHNGFQTHPHKDMEIVSYVIEGELTHRDSMGNEGIIKRGQVQYMSAGRGVYHSEINEGDKTVRLLQIWILPDAKGLEPSYGDFKFDWSLRENKLLYIASNKDGNAPVKLNQDINMYAIELEAGKKIDFEVAKNRQCYVVQIEGSSRINDIVLNERDALESIEESLKIEAISTAHLLFIEMLKS